MNLETLSRESLWVLILLAILFAFIVPDIGQIFTPYVIYPLILVMFFTMLRISIGDILSTAHEKRLVLGGLAACFVLTPIIAALTSFFIEPEYAIGLVFYSALPSATSAAFYVSKLGGKGALSLFLTATTMILAPVITPFITLLFTGSQVEMEAFGMFLNLLKFIILPLIAAEIIRYFISKNGLKKLSSTGNLIAPICMFFVVFGTVSVSSGDFFDLGALIAACLVVFAGSFVAGYLIAPKGGIAIGYGAAFRNSSLGMVIALETLGPLYAVPCVLMTLIHNIALIPLIFFSKKRVKASAHVI